MIKLSRYGDVTRFDLARKIGRRPLYWTTAYLIDGLLLDTGCAHTAPELMQALADRPLVRIVNTHTHEDHIGANGLLQRARNGLEILAHPAGMAVLSDPHVTQPLNLYQRIMWGWPGPSQGQPMTDGAVIETEQNRFQVIYTPGHSPDHLCLYEDQRGWLFSGDLFVGGQERTLRAGYDIWQIIASLKRIAALPTTMLFPGSARVRENPAGELAAKINYLEGLGAQVLDLHRRGRAVGEIVRTVCGGPLAIEFFTLGNFSRRRLVLSYLGRNNEV